MYRRELERQVCEVGFDYRTAPPEDRPEPHHFSEAIRLAIADKKVSEHKVQIRGNPYLFWSWSSTRRGALEAHLRRKVAALEVFLGVEMVPEVSGWHAEQIHHAALVSTPGWLSVGWHRGSKITNLGSHRVEDSRKADADIAGHHQASGIPFVVQVKNGREWFYPPDQVVWHLLGTAAQLHAVPILIARRLPERLFTLMKLVGGFGFQSLKMILPEEVPEPVGPPNAPTFAQAIRTLGFHSDIDFISDPLPRHKALWSGIVNEEIGATYDRFLSFRLRVLDLAYDGRLSAGATGEVRASPMERMHAPARIRANKSNHCRCEYSRRDRNGRTMCNFC